MSVPTLLSERINAVNAEWQIAYDAASMAQTTVQKAILGIDIGGTKIGWAVYPMVNGRLQKSPIASGHMATPKGLEALADSYGDLLMNAMRESANRGHIIAAISAGSPGRFITDDQFKKTYPAPTGTPQLIASIGDPYAATPNGNNAARGSASPNDTIAAGSARSLDKIPGEFDGVKLGALLQRLSPAGLQVVVNNDAALQLVGLANALRENPGTRALVEGKKIVYMGPGTGLGGAVMLENGNIVTDGHYQFMKLSRRSDSPNDTAAYQAIAHANRDQYAALEKPPTAVRPQEMLSGTGIGIILKDVFKDSSMTPENFDEQYANPVRRTMGSMPTAIARMKSAGRYYGDVMVALYKGAFTFMDKRDEWPAKDKEAVQGFNTVIFGGGVSRAGFFHEIVVPEARKVLAAHGIENRIALAFPENAVAAATQAAAATVSKGVLALSPAALQEVNQHARRELINHHARLKLQAQPSQTGTGVKNPSPEGGM